MYPRSSRSMRSGWDDRRVATGDIQIWYGEKSRRKKIIIITTNTRFKCKCSAFWMNDSSNGLLYWRFLQTMGACCCIGTGTTIIIVMMIVDQWILYITCSLLFFCLAFVSMLMLSSFLKLQVSVCCGEPRGDQTWGVRVGFCSKNRCNLV